VVSSFRTKCKDFVFARGQEKKDLLTQLQSSASRPVQSSPSHNYPTYVCAPSLVSGLACAELVLVPHIERPPQRRTPLRSCNSPPSATRYTRCRRSPDLPQSCAHRHIHV
jgi:hypothetical protein